jgi:hypothetical protein
MKRNALALGLGLLALVVLGWTLLVQWPGVNTSQAATPLQTKEVVTPAPEAVDPSMSLS